MAKMTEKTLAAKVMEVIKADKLHAKQLKEVTVDCLLFAAEHGRCEMFTQLQLNVSKGSADAIRQFVINCLNNPKFGFEYETDNGNKRRTVFFDWIARKNTWAIITDKTTDSVARLEAAKQSREAFLAATHADFESIELGSVKGTGEGNSSVFDDMAFDKALHNLVMRAAKNGISISRLKPIAAQIENRELKVSEAEIKAVGPNLNKAKEDLEKARQEVARLEALEKGKPAEKPGDEEEKTAIAA